MAQKTQQKEQSKAEVLARAETELQQGRQTLIEAEAEYDKKVDAARRGTISTGLAKAADTVELAELRIKGLEDALAAAQLDYDRDIATEVADLLREKVTPAVHGQRLSELEASLIDVLRRFSAEVDSSNAALRLARQRISALSEESRRMLWDEHGVKLSTGIGGGVQIDGVVHESKPPARVLERLLPNAIRAAGFRKPTITNL